jgi:predicted nucleic acid-binding protein
MRVYFDSSGLAKRYIKERGSGQVEETLSRASEVAVNLTAPPEIISALSRLRRQKQLSGTQYDLAKKTLFEDVEEMTVCSITVSTVHKAIELLERHPLRTLDALHVASALEWKPDLFVSADRRQLAAAEHEGLSVRAV